MKTVTYEISRADLKSTQLEPEAQKPDMSKEANLKPLAPLLLILLKEQQTTSLT